MWEAECVRFLDEGRKPCVGMCYTLKLLKMAQDNKQKVRSSLLYIVVKLIFDSVDYRKLKRLGSVWFKKKSDNISNNL